jgi:hypothetical protein
MVQEYPLKVVVQDSRRKGICHLIFFKCILLKKPLMPTERVI